ncbi:MAG: bifunctional phosphopantothenoylcysteine decarboxylase/phosphopantothenate--cysteine ligase CoaBC [Bradymonadaceae bacterium]|nr:bifunctional phosphopantothenoylcysteine decarboxylase/phosphopantothenate--cysteine ligase CoaBC [Lujinxingiaceae bacterium]
MKVLLGVTGGIAAYKAAEITRALVKRGDEVRVVMSAGAREFITPLTFQVLSGNPVGTEIFDPNYESEIGHIELARWADVVLVAPATANFIARLCAGMSDDLLTTVLLATRAPVVIAPAMNTQMWGHVFVQRNIAMLAEHPGYHVVDPDSGELACKEVGAGRLPDPEVVLEALDRARAPQLLAGHRVLISAGPTREAIDPARFLSNPSTGKMGFALARVAHRMGARVTLVAGPTTLRAPAGVESIPVNTAREMHSAITTRAESMDIVVMAAAVADWRPKIVNDSKQTKSSISPTLELEANPDILAELGARFGGSDASGPLLVGFAAESDYIKERGLAKMQRKQAHMLVANKIGGPDSAFGADSSSVVILTAESSMEVGPATKEELATRILQVAAAIQKSR